MGPHIISSNAGSQRRPGADAAALPLRPLLDDIRRLVQFLRVSSRETERRLGISGAQLFVLDELARGSADSLGELAERTFTHQSSVSAVVKRLVERKLVSRRSDRQDGRRTQLAITKKGRELLDGAPEVAQIRLIRALGELPSRERSSLARGLSSLVARLGLGSDAAALFFEEEAARRAES